MAIDLGHHQVFAALTIDEEAPPVGVPPTSPSVPALVPLGSDGDGLVVRWCEDGKPAERLHDRLDRLVEANNIRGSADTAAAIADCLAELVPNDDVRTARVAVPLCATPGHRAHLRTALVNAGIPVTEHDLIGRPYAVLCHWLAIDGHRRAGLPRGKTLILDNDGGRVSALVVDIAQRTVLAERQITTTSVPDPYASTLVLRELLDAAYGSLGHETPVPWSVLSASIAEIVVAGSGAAHPVFTRFLSERFPASTLHEAPESPEEIVVRGLAHLDRLDDYRCAWPTLDLRFDERVVRPAGCWSASIDGAPTVAPVGTNVRFGDAPLVVRGSTASSDLSIEVESDAVMTDAALQIPDRLGPFPLLSLHPSGSIEIRGIDASIRLHLDWPVAGAMARALTAVVENILDLTIDRTPFTPRGDPPHRATDES